MAVCLNCEQYIFGKLVQRSRGPIVPGYEHRGTGKSRNFPGGVMQFCHPEPTGLSADMSFNWEQYPWLKEGGGIIVRPLDSSPPRLLAGRILGLSEKGANIPGRIFTQAHYVTFSASDWQPECLPDLVRILRAEPMVAENNDLPAIVIEVSDRDEPLPADWLERCKRYLEPIMSGQAISHQDWEMSIGEFMSNVKLCFCLMPTAIAWRVPFGAGIVNMDGTVPLAHGMKANKGLRIVAQKRLGDEDLDFSLGRAYLELLQEILSETPTLKEAREAIINAMPEFSKWDSIPLNFDWRAAAIHISQLISEKLLLRKLDIAGEPVRFDLEKSFRYRRVEALGKALGRLDVDGLRNLETATGPDWEEVWEQYAENKVACAVGGLFGVLPVADPESLKLIRTLNLTPGREPKVVADLVEVLKNSNEPEAWHELAAAMETDAKWLNDWRQAGRRWLTWLAYEGRLEFGSDVLLTAITNQGLNLVATGLEQFKDDVSSPLKDLLAGISEREEKLIDQLLAQYIVTEPVSACKLFEAYLSSANKPPTIEFWRGGSAIERPEFRAFVTRLAEAVTAGRPPLFPELALFLLYGWANFTDVQRHGLAPELSAAIGMPFANLLLDRKMSTTTLTDRRYRPVCEQVLAFHLRTNPQFGLRLAELVEQKADGYEQVLTFLADWLDHADTETLKGRPVFTIIAILKQQGLLSNAKEIYDSVKIRDLFFRLFVELKLAPDLEKVLSQVESYESLMHAFAIIKQWPGAAALNAAQLAKLIIQASENSDRQAALMKKIRELLWHEIPQWRLLYGLCNMLKGCTFQELSQMGPDSVEAEALRRLPTKCVVFLLANGLPKNLACLTNVDRVTNADIEVLTIPQLNGLISQTRVYAMEQLTGLVEEFILLQLEKVLSNRLDELPKMVREAKGSKLIPGWMLRPIYSNDPPQKYTTYLKLLAELNPELKSAGLTEKVRSFVQNKPGMLKG